MARLEKRFTQFCYLALLCGCLIFLPGCEQQQPMAQTEPVPTEFQTYRIGLVPEHNLFDQKKRYEPLLNYLSKHLGVTLQGVVLPRYGSIIENFSLDNLDGAFFGSFTGAIALSQLELEPIALPQYINGETSNYGMVFAKKGRNLRSPGSLRNKRIVFVDPATTTGYLLPLSYLNALGIKDYRNWLAESYFSGTHEDAIYDVLYGLADIGAAKNTVFYRLAETDKRIIEELEILATSPRMPANMLAMLKDIPDDLQQGLREKLLTMHLTYEGRKILAGLRIERFINASSTDYRPVIDYANSVGLDLSSCQPIEN